MLVACCCASGGALLGNYLCARLASYVGRDIRNAVYDASLTYSGGDFEEFGTGSMITRTLNDVNVIQQTVMLATQAMLPVPIICVMGTVLSFRVDAQMGAMMLAVVSVVMVFAVYLGGMTRGVESDAHTAAQAINWLAAFPSTVLTQLATTVIVVIVLAQLLLAREWLQAAVSALAMFAGYGIVWVISTAISSLNDFTLPMALVSAATSYGSGLLPAVSYTHLRAHET